MVRRRVPAVKDQQPPGEKDQQPAGEAEERPMEDVDAAVAWLRLMTARLEEDPVVRDEILVLLTGFGKGRGDPEAVESIVEDLLQLQEHPHVLAKFRALVTFLTKRKRFAAMEVLAETAPKPGLGEPPAAAMEDWRGLAATLPENFATVALGTAVLNLTLKSAHTKLDFGCAALAGALGDLARLDALHSGTGYAYRVYTNSSALVAGDEERQALEALYQSWQGRSRYAVPRALNAKRYLRAAASTARAAADAHRVSQSLPSGSPRRAEWEATAQGLARLARVKTSFAGYALRRMRDATALEFYDTWRSVNG